MYQWLDFITNPQSGEEVPNIYWLVTVFPGNTKNYGRIDPDVKAWIQPVNLVKVVFRNI